MTQVTPGTLLIPQILDITHTVLQTQHLVVAMLLPMMVELVEHRPTTVTTTVIHTDLTVRIQLPKMDTCTTCGIIGQAVLNLTRAILVTTVHLHNLDLTGKTSMELLQQAVLHTTHTITGDTTTPPIMEAKVYSSHLKDITDCGVTTTSVLITHTHTT